jgi:hypothetical protein
MESMNRQGIKFSAIRHPEVGASWRMFNETDRSAETLVSFVSQESTTKAFCLASEAYEGQIGATNPNALIDKFNLVGKLSIRSPAISRSGIDRKLRTIKKLGHFF